MDAAVLTRYADLIVSVGANVQPDQVLSVEALPEAQPLVAEIARAAYARGARYVDAFYFDPAVKRIRAERAPDGTLDWVPPWIGRRILDLGDLDAARAVLVPVVPPGLLDGVDPARAGLDRLPTVPEIFKVIDERSVAWTLSPFPTRRWAQTVYPELHASEALERLWEDIVHVCRLDEPDPAAAWIERIDEIWQVANRLDALDLDALHFAGPGTDLTVGLLPSSRFAKEGGASHTRTGVRHMPNIPTEEVYTTPDPERTEGVVSSTKPLDVAGSLVTGLRIRFEGGRAVEIDADANAEALRKRCAVDAGASRLGEVALVDRESRIGKLGRTFYTTLLDENAASHLALGDAYSSPVADPADVERINASGVHIDFMIGSDEVEVTGIAKSGEPRDGHARRRLADLGVRDRDRPLEPHDDRLRQLPLGARGAGRDLVVVEEVEGRDVAAADPRERRVPVDLRLLRERDDPRRREAGRLELAAELRRIRESCAVDRLERREQPVQPEAVEVRRVEGGDERAAARREHAAELRQGPLPVDEMDGEPHHGALEPAVAERQLLGAALAHARALRHPSARDLDHRRLGVDRPDARGGSLGERRGEHAGPAADLEHAPPAQVALADEQVEELPPVRVRRAEVVVARGARREVGTTTTAQRSVRPAR